MSTEVICSLTSDVISLAAIAISLRSVIVSRRLTRLRHDRCDR